MIINIQFTLVSMLLGLAGILGIMNINERERYISYIFPFLLLFFSSLIRVEAFCLVFVVGSMYVLLNKIPLLKSPIFLKACTLLFFFIAFSIWINKLSYSSPDWSVYSKYNQMRGKINDNPNLSPNNISQIEKKLSVSNLEINLFNSFVYTQSFNEEKLVNIANEVSHPVDMKMYIGYVYYWLRYYKYAIVLVLITLLISRRMFITNLLPIASLLLIFLIICYNHLPKDRIMMMLFFEVILFTLFINNFSNRLSYLICLLGIIWMADNYQKGVNNIYRNCKNDYLQLDPTKTYIPLFPIEYAYPNDIHPFDTRKYTEINMIAAGWLTNSPFQKFQLSALKLNTTIPISVLDLNTEKSNVVYLGKMNRENQTGLINSYLSTKNKKLKLTETKSNFCLYSIQKNVENN